MHADNQRKYNRKRAVTVTNEMPQDWNAMKNLSESESFKTNPLTGETHANAEGEVTVNSFLLYKLYHVGIENEVILMSQRTSVLSEGCDDGKSDGSMVTSRPVPVSEFGVFVTPASCSWK